ncbi:MAG: hypothetical protein AAFY65_13430 [Pseudomonadota bacterium]
MNDDFTETISTDLFKNGEVVTHGHLIQAIEASYFCRLLNRTNGNAHQAACLAGMSYATFNRRVRNMGLRIRFEVA